MLDLMQSDLADLLALETRVKGEKCIMQAQAHLSQQENQELWSLKKYESGLLSNLDVYDTSVIERKQLFEFPPEFLAVPHKPFLFDLALISLDYPSLDGRVAAKKSIWNFWR